MNASWGRLALAGHPDPGVVTKHNSGSDGRHQQPRAQDDAASLSSGRAWRFDSTRSTPSFRTTTPTSSFRSFNRAGNLSYEESCCSEYSTPATSFRATSSRSKRAHTIRQSQNRVSSTSLREPVCYRAYSHDELANSIRLRPEEREELRAKLSTMRVRPVGSKGTEATGSINENPRVIPYTGKGVKQDSWTRTGRKRLEVIQYTFTRESDGQTFTVMWDYQVGLVRIRPFFAAVEGHDRKTKPLFAIKQNPGLQDLSYNITGGAIDAQGYWMPFSCARALCAKFCYEIRWALTPIFGPAFIRDCYPLFEDYRIENQIIVNATIALSNWVQKPAQSLESSTSFSTSSGSSDYSGCDDGQADDESSEISKRLSPSNIHPSHPDHNVKLRCPSAMPVYKQAPGTPLSRPRRRRHDSMSTERLSPATSSQDDQENTDMKFSELSSRKRKAHQLEHNRRKRRSARDIELEVARLLGELGKIESDTQEDTEIDD